MGVGGRNVVIERISLQIGSTCLKSKVQDQPANGDLLASPVQSVLDTLIMQFTPKKGYKQTRQSKKILAVANYRLVGNLRSQSFSKVFKSDLLEEGKTG